ncbi:unnamed protein product [Prorocentrum cordatum]|uniref:Uncharacterized protein n=1 Tax=Prorocentrum cordatum TaxID=2364126 RepID=A0ABN9U0I5_9DINO|nr:unnamed protein product [Polarella glacialis]
MAQDPRAHLPRASMAPLAPLRAAVALACLASQADAAIHQRALAAAGGAAGRREALGRAVANASAENATEGEGPVAGANIFESFSAPVDRSAKGTYASSYISAQDRVGVKGNPLIWTMAVVYSGLTALAVVLYVVWSDHGRARGSEKPRADMGLPAGY